MSQSLPIVFKRVCPREETTRLQGLDRQGECECDMRQVRTRKSQKGGKLEALATHLDRVIAGSRGAIIALAAVNTSYSQTAQRCAKHWGWPFSGSRYKAS